MLNCSITPRAVLPAMSCGGQRTTPRSMQRARGQQRAGAQRPVQLCQAGRLRLHKCVRCAVFHSPSTRTVMRGVEPDWEVVQPCNGEHARQRLEPCAVTSAHKHQHKHEDEDEDEKGKHGREQRRAATVCHDSLEPPGRSARVFLPFGAEIVSTCKRQPLQDNDERSCPLAIRHRDSRRSRGRGFGTQKMGQMHKHEQGDSPA